MNSIVMPRVADFSVSLPKPTPHQVRTRLTIRNTWIERLALWAERQPAHHRLGSWTVI